MIRLAVVATAIVCGACAAQNTLLRANTRPDAANVSSTDSANVAATVNEPRRSDATAAYPAGPVPSTGTVLTVGKKQPPPTKTATSTPSSEDAAAAAAIASAAPPASARPAYPQGTAEEPKKIGARHVLVQWMGSDRAGKSVLRTREQALVLVQDVLKRAKAGEDIGRLAVEYSDEPNAGTRGGSLGRFGKGQMVGAFEQVAFKLAVGQVSEIVETPFGFHVIQRTE